MLPIESEVAVLEADGGMVLAIHVPRAPRDERPVYINNDLFGGNLPSAWRGRLPLHAAGDLSNAPGSGS